MEAEDIKELEELWIFGYGSIVWKNDEVERIEETSAFIRGYKRRFWQLSPWHRGTIDDPGLVVSIYSQEDWKRLGVAQQDAEEIGGADDNEWQVHGRAFRVTASYRDKVSGQ